MKLLVLNGSPKGNYSVTRQYFLYLEKLYTKDQFEILNVGLQIKSFEKQENITELKENIASSDVIVFAYPVYTFLAPAQLHRLIEILNENDISLDGKFITQFSTSMHFYDVTAHSIIKECLLDLGAKYMDGLSLEMEDLLNEDGRKSLTDWFGFLKYQVKTNTYISRPKSEYNVAEYCNTATLSSQKSNIKRVLVISDDNSNQSLSNMISDFTSISKYQTDVYNLNDFKFKCSCLGCLKCTSKGHCQINDGFEDLLNNTINKYDSVVMAFTIKNHAMSSLYKTYYDRQFVNGHRPVTAGKPTAYIISGRLSKEPTLQQYLDAKASVGGNYNCGVICDETATLESIQTTVNKLEYALENNIKPAKDFYEVGGMRIFRDMIWIMRGLMKEDYNFYKKNGLLDFPQKKRGTMIGMKFVGKLTRNKAITKKMPNILADGMLMTYKKVLDNAKPLE